MIYIHKTFCLESLSSGSLFRRPTRGNSDSGIVGNISCCDEVDDVIQAEDFPPATSSTNAFDGSFLCSSSSTLKKQTNTLSDASDGQQQVSTSSHLQRPPCVAPVQVAPPPRQHVVSNPDPQAPVRSQPLHPVQVIQKEVRSISNSLAALVICSATPSVFFSIIL